MSARVFRRRNRGCNSNNAKTLNESDINAYLDKYFEDFTHNLRNNNFDKMNVSLVNNIVDKFGMIFQLWDENRIFQASVDTKRFEKIHNSMKNVFDAENDRSYEPIVSNDFTLECNHCGEAFPLRNKDCRYSYDLHALSKDHRDFVDNLNTDDDDTAGPSTSGVRCNDKNPFAGGFTLTPFEQVMRLYGLSLINEKYDPFDPFNSLHQIQLDPLDPDSFQSSEIITVRSNKIQNSKINTSNPSTIANKNATTNKQTSVPKNDSISVFDASCIIFEKNALRCKICQVKLQPKQNILPHMIGKFHKITTKKYELEPYNFFMQKDGKEIRCNVCNGYKCTYLSTYLNHCQSADHLKKVNQSNTKLKNNIVQREIAKVLYCPVPTCSKQVSKFEELMEHLQSIHRIH